MRKVIFSSRLHSWLLLVMAGMLMVSCSSEVEEFEQQTFSVSFKIINEKGESATVFSNY